MKQFRWNIVALPLQHGKSCSNQMWRLILLNRGLNVLTGSGDNQFVCKSHLSSGSGQLTGLIWYNTPDYTFKSVAVQILRLLRRKF